MYDLHVDQWLGSDWIGQLVAEGPFIYLMGRLPLTRFIAVTMWVSMNDLTTYY